MIEYIWARDRALSERMLIMSYRTGLFAQADFRKIPSLETMLRSVRTVKTPAQIAAEKKKELGKGMKAWGL